jgi:hypothetical protein
MTEKVPDRITIYTKQGVRKETLTWLMRYYGARSVSEAIFMAIDEVARKKRERQKAGLKQALRKTQGLWAGDKEVEDALAEVEEIMGQWGIQTS